MGTSAPVTVKTIALWRVQQPIFLKTAV